MCQLMVSEFVRTVITTNFDDLLLRALQLYLEVPASLDSDSLDTLMTNSSFLQVAYRHGKLSSYRQRHTGRELQQPISHFEKFLTPALKDHGLVVIGYRGGDEQPMGVLEKVLWDKRAGPGRGLFWISYEPDFEKLSDGAKRILQLKDTYWLPGWDAAHPSKSLCAGQGIGLSLPDPRNSQNDSRRSCQRKRAASWSATRGTGLVTDVSALDLTVQTTKDQEGKVTASEGESAAGELQQHIEPITDLWRRPKRLRRQSVSARPALARNPLDGEAFLRWGSALSELDRSEEALAKYENMPPS